MKRNVKYGLILMLAMTAYLTGYTQTDTTRLVPVKAYKLGYLIRDAYLLRICDSLANAQTESINAKNLLNANLEKQVLSLNLENQKLIQKDSAREVNARAAQDIYVIEKAELKQDKKTLWKVIFAEFGVVGILVAILLI